MILKFNIFGCDNMCLLLDWNIFLIVLVVERIIYGIDFVMGDSWSYLWCLVIIFEI